MQVGISSLVSSQAQTALMAGAICLHNVPEGMAVAAAVYGATGNKVRAVLISAATGLVEPLSALLSVLLLAPVLTQTLVCS
jgi:ZIP family zinc transporter